MQNEKGALILGVETRISVPVARSLHNHGIPVYLGSFSSSDPRIHSRAVAQFVRFPNPTESPARFTDAVLHFVESRDVDALIPVTDGALSAVSENYDQLRQGVQLACPSPRVLQRVLSKKLTLGIAERCGIEIPREFLISGSDDLTLLGSTFNFPVVAKPTEKRSTELFKVRYFQDFAALSSAFEKGVLRDALLQEFCPGDGVGVEMLVHNGECLAAFQHRRLKEFPHLGGVAVVAVAEALDPDLYERSLALLRALEWEGVAMVEYRQDRLQRKVALMEVNGRYWGTLSLAIQAGVDFPWYQWQAMHSTPAAAPSSYRVGVRWRWTPGYLRRLRGLLPAVVRLGAAKWRRDLLLSFRDFLPPVRDSVLILRDPLPAVEEFSRTLSRIISLDARSLAKRALPKRIRETAVGYFELERDARRLWFRKRAFRFMRNSKRLTSNDVRRNIVFVCRGNIIRSPMAEALLKKLCASLRDLSVTSAGLHAVPGMKADSRAEAVAREFGVSLVNHRTKLLNRELVTAAEAIFVMDCFNEAELLARYPESRHKIFMLGDYADPSAFEIADPYNGDVDSVRRCYATLHRSIEGLAKQLHSRHDSLELKGKA